MILIKWILIKKVCSRKELKVERTNIFKIPMSVTLTLLLRMFQKLQTSPKRKDRPAWISENKVDENATVPENISEISIFRGLQL